VDPTDDEIIWLYELAKERMFPAADAPPAFLVPPVVLGAGTRQALALHEPTVAALSWLEEYASRWWDERDIRPVAYAYHMSSPGKQYLFEDLTTRRHARRVVNRWYRKLPFAESLIDWAVAEIQGVPEGSELCQVPNECLKPEATSNPLEWGDVIATMSAANGIPPQHYAAMNKSLLARIWDNLDKTPLAQMMSGENAVRDGSGGGAMIAMHAAMRHIAKEHGVDIDADSGKPADTE
jgi:hypothetical protein